MQKKFDSLNLSLLTIVASVIGVIFFLPTPSADATGYTWTSATIETASVSSSRILYDRERAQFAVGYVLSDATQLRFATSTAGSSWATPVSAITTTNLITLDPFFTSSSAAGGGDYIFMAMVGNASTRYLASSGGGSTWSNTALTTVDHYASGAIHTTANGHTYLAGTVSIGGSSLLVSAKTTSAPSADGFTSTTAVGALSGPSPDFAYSSLVSTGVIAYSALGATTIGVVTTTDMLSWTNYGFTPPGSNTVFIRPRVKFDSAGKIYIVYLAANDMTCTTSCKIMVSSRVGGNWTTETIDTVGNVSFNAQHDITFVNGTIPVITYYNVTDGKLRYAYRDSGNSGCSGADGASWTCGDVATGLTMPPSVSITTNNSTGVVIAYQASTTLFKAASATLSAASANYGSFTHTVPSNPTVIVNNNDATTASQIVTVDATAGDASEVAISNNVDFFNSIWLPIGKKYQLKLNKTAGKQLVYAKFTNPTGGISPVVTDDIVYEPPVVNVPQTPAPTAPKPVESSAPISQPLLPPPINIIPLPYYNPNDDTTPFLSEEIPQVAVSTPIEQPSCPERPNAFSLGGTIMRDASGKLYLKLNSQNTVCAVPSYAVAQSWGVRTFARGSIKDYRISSPLPYRSGTIVRDARLNKWYFANTKGKLHEIATLTQLKKLGYKSTLAIYDTSSVIAQYNKSATLTRTDIHPDGTLFLLDARTKEYAILQNRVLHPVSYKSLLGFKENPARAVRALAGETYPIKERWD